MIMLSRFYLYILLCFYIFITSSQCNPLNSNIWVSSTQYSNNNNYNNIISSTSQNNFIPDTPPSDNRLTLSHRPPFSPPPNEPFTTFQKVQHTNNDNTNTITRGSSTFSIQYTTTLTDNSRNTVAAFHKSNSDDMTSIISTTPGINALTSHSVSNLFSTTDTTSANVQKRSTIETSMISDASSDAYNGLLSSTLDKTTDVQSIISAITTSITISSLQDSVSSHTTDPYTNSQYTIHASSMDVASISTFASYESIGTKHNTNILEASTSTTHLTSTTQYVNSDVDLLPSLVEISSSIIQSSKKYSPTSSDNNISIQTSTFATINTDSIPSATISKSLSDSIYSNDNNVVATTTNQESDSVVLNNRPTSFFIPKQMTTSLPQNDNLQSKISTQSTLSANSDKDKGDMNSANDSNIDQKIQYKNQVDDSNPTVTIPSSAVRQATASSTQVENKSSDEFQYIQTTSSDVTGISGQESENTYNPKVPLENSPFNTPASSITMVYHGLPNAESITTQYITSSTHSIDNNNNRKPATISISSSGIYGKGSLTHMYVGSVTQSIETATISRNNMENTSSYTMVTVEDIIFSTNDNTRFIHSSNEQPAVVKTNIVSSVTPVMTTFSHTRISYTSNSNNLFKLTRLHSIHHSKNLNRSQSSRLMKSQGNVSTSTTTAVRNIRGGTDKFDLDNNDGSKHWLPTSIQYDAATDAIATINPIMLDDLPAAITPSKSINAPFGYELITIGFQYKLHYAFLVSKPLTTAQIFHFLPRIIIYPIVYYLKETHPNLQIHFTHKRKPTSISNNDFNEKYASNIRASNINITWPLCINGSSNLITPLDAILGNDYSLKNSSVILYFSNFEVKKIVPYTNSSNNYIMSLAEVYVPKNYTTILQWLVSNTNSIFYKNSKENLRTLASLIDNSLPISNTLRNASSGSSVNWDAQNSNISNFKYGATSDNHTIDSSNLSILGFSDIISGGIDTSLTDRWNINDGSINRVIIFIFCLTSAVFIWIYFLLQLSKLFNKNEHKELPTTEDEKKQFPYQYNPYSDKSLSTVIRDDNFISLTDPSVIGSSYSDICEKLQTRNYDTICTDDDTSAYYSDEHAIHYVIDSDGNFYYSKKNMDSEPSSDRKILTEVDNNVKILNKVLPISPINPGIASDYFDLSSAPPSTKIYSTYINTVYTSMTSPSSVTFGNHVKESKNIDLSTKNKHFLTASYYASDLSLYIGDTDDEDEGTN